MCDNLGRMISQTDPLDNVTTYAYDSRGRQYRVTQPDPDGAGGLDCPVTNYFYDAAGNLASLVDPVGNETSYAYDGLNRKIEETNELDDTRYFEYDAAGHLIEKTDRNERVTQYVFDPIGRLLEENWLDAQQQTIWTIAYVYNSAGRLQSVGDDAAEYAYTYDDAGRMLTETQTIDGLSPVIVFTYQYDAEGKRTQIAATVGGTADFVIDYEYDYLDRLTQIEQHGVQGGNAVAEKRVDFTYDGATGQYAATTRYKDLDGGSGNVVMTGTYDYDDMGRLTDLLYTDSSSTTLRSFSWTFDAASRIIGHDSDIASEDVADGDYDYDATNQLIGADYTDANRDDESYAYDENGNRVTANGDTYTTGDNNQTTSDGTYSYLFDEEGNRTAKFIDEDESGTLNTGDTDITEYSWDHRNRMTEAAHRATFSGSVDWTAEYKYDSQNRRIAALYDTDGDAVLDREERYVWNGKNVALDFVDADGGGETYSLDLARRYLWGAAVDQLLAQETVDNGGPEDILWPATDNLGSVRSLVASTGSIAATYTYDTFGTVTVLVGSLTDTRYLYTCQEYDAAISLYYYDARYYDSATGKFVSEDMIGYRGGMNLYEYVGNLPLMLTDPQGLEAADRECKWYIEREDVGPQPGRLGKIKRFLGNCCGGHWNIVSTCDGMVFSGYNRGPINPKWKKNTDNSYVQLWPNDVGSLKWGSKKKCSEATTADIVQCLRSKPPFKGDYFAGSNDCQTDTSEAAKECCLRGRDFPLIFPMS